jgi:hypothetical protein
VAPAAGNRLSRSVNPNEHRDQLFSIGTSGWSAHAGRYRITRADRGIRALILEPVEEPARSELGSAMMIVWLASGRRVVLTQGRAFGYEQW